MAAVGVRRTCLSTKSSHRFRSVHSGFAGENRLTTGKGQLSLSCQRRGLLLMRSPRIVYLLGASHPLAFTLVAHHATRYRRAIAPRRPLPG